MAHQSTLRYTKEHMTFDQFIKKYLGKKVDFDGAYSGQCMDLYRQYCKDVLGVPQSPPVRGAADIWDTYLKDHFNRVANSPSGFPKKGDIVLWDKDAGGGFGHVAIFIEGDANTFISLDQNWPTLSEVTKTKHGYKDVLGWLTPKVWIEDLDPDTTTDTYTEDEMTKIRLERDANWNSYQSEIAAHAETKKQLEQALIDVKSRDDEIERRKKESRERIEKYAKALDLPAAADEITVEARLHDLLKVEDVKTDLEKKLKQEEQKHDTEVNSLIDQIAVFKKQIADQNNQIDELKRINSGMILRLDELENRAEGVHEKREQINFLEYIMQLLKRK